MIEPKQNFLDRIEQTFILYKSDFLNVSLYYIWFIILNWIIFKWFTLLIMFVWLKFVNVENLNIDTSLYINLTYIIVIFMIVFITLLIIQIPFYLSLILNVNQLYKGEKITYKENFFIALKNIKKAFYTYRYIFKYVWLIPCLLLIVWLLIIIFDLNIWLIIIWITFIISLYFIFYRWTQICFSMISAVSYNSFTVDNFTKSISITKNKLWRIFWNLFWLWIIIWLSLSIFNLFLSLFISSDNYSEIITSLITQSNNPNFDLAKSIPDIKNQLTPTFAWTINSIFHWIINDIIKWIIFIFTLIFSFIFFKRLENEANLEIKSND